MDRLYSFVMRGELAKVSLSYTEALSRHHTSDIIVQDYIKSLSLDLLDDEYINTSKLMATIYIAISAFENTIREFVVKILMKIKVKIGGKIVSQTKFAKRLKLGRNKKIR